MTKKKKTEVQLIDPLNEAGRTTASMVASLASRLITLHYTSGVSVIGSLVAGLAAAGREAAKTSRGAQLRKALLAGTAGANGEALWAALRIGDWASGLPASPVLDHVRNDLALLLSDDLKEALETTPILPEYKAGSQQGEPQPVTCIDCLMGLWLYSGEIVRSIEALAGRSPCDVPELEGDRGQLQEDDSGMLR